MFSLYLPPQLISTFFLLIPPSLHLHSASQFLHPSITHVLYFFSFVFFIVYLFFLFLFILFYFSIHHLSFFIPPSLKDFIFFLFMFFVSSSSHFLIFFIPSCLCHHQEAFSPALRSASIFFSFRFLLFFLLLCSSHYFFTSVIPSCLTSSLETFSQAFSIITIFVFVMSESSFPCLSVHCLLSLLHTSIPLYSALSSTPRLRISIIFSSYLFFPFLAFLGSS